MDAVEDLVVMPVDLTAAILCGGQGTRLRPVVADRPKVLAEVQGRPFLAHLLDRLAAYGVANVVLCTGYQGDQVEALFGDSYGGLRLLHSQEAAPLGTAGALRAALPLLQGNPVLVMNGDSYCETDLRTFWAWHHSREAEGSVLLTRMADSGRYGRVHLDAAGRLVGFEEKSADGGPGWINAGIYLLDIQLLETIPVGRFVSLEQEMLPQWLTMGSGLANASKGAGGSDQLKARRLYGYKSEGRFLDIGTPESYAAAHQLFAEEALA